MPAGESIGPAFDAWRTFSQATPDFKTGRIVDGGCVRELSSSEVAAYDAPYPDEDYQAHPSAEQAKAFLSGAEDGPMCMVNLLKFRDKATYADGSEPDLWGCDAYLRYGAGIQACLAAVGGETRFSGFLTYLMLGEVEELWDMVAIAEYPSRAAMLKMVQSPEYQAITKHRDAGFAGQLNIRTKAIGL